MTRYKFNVNHPSESDGIQLVENPTNPYQTKTLNGASVLAPALNADYFHRGGISFRVNDAFPVDAGVAFLIIEHSDCDIGLIQVTYDADVPDDPLKAGSDPANQPAETGIGRTCLGTGKIRRALFRLEKPGFRHRQKLGADIRIAGANALRSVSLTTALEAGEWERVRSEIPDALEPRMKLNQPMQLVMAVGADARTLDELPDALDRMRDLCPVARLLGFNGVESYVKWNFVEPQKGRFDWHFYDAVVDEARKHQLKWFPLLIVGSAYTLPEWYFKSPENVGFKCLEHDKGNYIQTIFCDNQTPYVKAFLNAFGTHYEPKKALLGVRLGPSGNFGESQYPASGEWGFKWAAHHIHIGWWAGDEFAASHFQAFLKQKYASIAALNSAWDENYSAFEDIKPFIPQFAEVKRKRKDFIDWYVWAMTDWCEKWAIWSREAMPQTAIYQSAGGWGFVESGTDFTDQTKSMTLVNGGIRATNEDDSYIENFVFTRMMSSAARFYKVPFGTEPAGFNSARGVASRIFNVLVNNGQHLFFYFPNILHNDQAVEKWLELAPLLDQLSEPLVEVAALYPDTLSKLDDSVFRHLYTSSFYQRVFALRPHLDFDFCSERMILDGALSQYKVLVFLWSDIVEAAVIEAIDRWIQAGGVAIYPYWHRMSLCSVEGDYSIFNRWLRGETGRGTVIFEHADRIPPTRFADFIKSELLKMKDLSPHTQKMLRIQKPSEVFVSALKNGNLVILNYNDDPVEITLPDDAPRRLESYSIELIGT
ncbi:beta-galactosidase [candidate division KSB1 bacterium]|nr:beta-galactosidase [candidate division KSB1 bacterium]